MTIPYRPLGLIATLIESMGLQVTYAYDDLVFISHNAFLLRMGEQGEDLFLYFNEESDDNVRQDIAQQLIGLGIHHGLSVHESGTYQMSPADAENLNINFYDYELT